MILFSLNLVGGVVLYSEPLNSDAGHTPRPLHMSRSLAESIERDCLGVGIAHKSEEPVRFYTLQGGG